MMHNIRSFTAGPHRLPFMDRPSVRIVAQCLGVGIAALLSAARAADSASLPSLEGASIDELLNVRVTTVSRGESTIGKSPAAAFVVTQEMIRRSGATSVPEVLRLVPGLQVARIDSHRWAIAVRGFNQEFSNKLLVMIDGRAVYSPLFSGVRWDQQDPMLEDIERIEVVRGPAAALWGANAVNGVINIISKSARDTQGTVVSGGWGNEETGFGAIRFGGMIGEEIFYRAYAKAQSLGDTKFPNGSTSEDSWNRFQTGFRIDAQPNGDDRLTLQGDVGFGEPRELFNPFGTTAIIPDTIRHLTANLLGRWTRTLGPDSDFTLQAYYDFSKREVFNQTERLGTFDLDFQHHLRLGVRHALTWGGGYRLTMDDIVFAAPLGFDERNRNIHLGRLFLRDDITLVDERLTLTLGSHIEYYSFSGFDYQPTGRLTWTPTARQTAWAAVSRALRTPSRADNDLRVTTTIPPTSILPNKDLNPERVHSYELGYRAQLHERFSVDVALFYSDYDRLRSREILAPGITMRDEKIHGETYGGEVALSWQPTNWWHLRAAYSYLQIQLHNAGGGTDPTTTRLDEGRNPEHQAWLHSSWDITRSANLDATVRYVDQLRSVAPFPDIPSYVELDLRLAWRPHPNLELSVVGLNLLDSSHPEFLPGAFGFLGQPREIPRSIYGMVTWRF